LVKLANEEKKETNDTIANHKTQIKLLRNAAAVLEKTRPDLAADLTKTADRKARWLADKKEGNENTAPSSP
jgi:peptidoglycan hydrolase CwlO-like protein